MKKRLLFLDRDGTIIKEPPDYQIDAFEKLEFLPGAITHLAKIAQEGLYELVMVTNQDGIGTEAFPEEAFWGPHNLMMKILEKEGIVFHGIHIDPHFEEDHAPTRKPGTGMLEAYFSEEYDLAHSVVVGDRHTDVQLAHNLGAKAIRIAEEPDPEADLTTTSWEEIYRFLRMPERIGEVQRNTKETAIRIRLNLDGSGQADIRTGLGFFDHMLEQIAKHGMLDLQIHCQGDLHIDEHHSIEDTALALGEAFRKALGEKRGINRYGFLLPMDESLAQVALDFGGRNWLVWEAAFQREKIGEMPTEMFSHFFKSFSDAAQANLHITAKGENEHHKIEGIFKAFAKALKMAVARDPEKLDQLPSTKGML